MVIDPGHGGSDVGATAHQGKKIFQEKDLTLQIAKDAAQFLKKKKIKVMLTRENDENLPLHARTALANRVGANAFVSIHINSETLKKGEEPTAHGIETYLFHTSGTESSTRLAELENSAHSALAGSSTENQKKTEVGLILKDLILDANIKPSKSLACAVQKKIIQSLPRPLRSKKDRGVRQAMFYVLLGADMPAILLEAGFITHPKDRVIFHSRRGLRRIGRALAEAIIRFKNGKSQSNCLVH